MPDQENSAQPSSNPPKRKVTVRSGKDLSGKPVVVRPAQPRQQSDPAAPAPRPAISHTPQVQSAPAPQKPRPSVPIPDDRAAAPPPAPAAIATDFLAAAAAITFTVLIAAELLPYL